MSIRDETTLMQAISQIEAGGSVRSAIALNAFTNADAAREVSQILELSRTFGSETLPVLRELHDRWVQERENRQQLESELAAPMLTKRIIGWLPVGAFAIAQLMGFDMLATANSPFVMLSLALGGTMLFVSQLWCGRILAMARPKPDPVTSELRSALVVMSAGATWLQTRRHLELSVAAMEAVAPAIETARKLGSPIGPALHREIRLRQKRLDADAISNIREAGVRLSLPMGFAMLPALVFLVVIPIFAAITKPQIGIT